MSRILRWALVVCCACVAIALGAAAWHRLSRPTVLTVAVGPADFDDAALISAFARKFVAGGSPVRLSIVPTSGPADAFERLKKGEAQLAVVRSDGNGSEQAQAVALLHTDPVVIVAAEKTGIESFGDLKGKTIGVVGPPGANDSLLRTLRQHYQAPGENKTLAPVPLEVSTAIRTRAVDALLFVVPTTRGVKLGESWALVRSASRRKLAFVSLDEPEALAAANPAYESGEIEAGQFGGSPSLPEESVTTITVATYLVANRNVSADAITALTRTLFQERQAISGEAPIANLIKAASTEKDAVYPLHPGAKVYYSGEETSLMERHGDWLFYGPMLLGALGSGFLVVLRFLGFRDHQDQTALLARIREVISSIKEAQTIAELDAIRADVDGAVERLAESAARGEFDEHRTAVLSLAINYIDHLLAERGALLLSGHGMSSSDSLQVRLSARS
ncbi:MAG: transporter solute receptor, family [Rhodospirillales bacterium]|nr:transporter solute receptor, family [Rhodospirillales bacterium]